EVVVARIGQRAQLAPSEVQARVHRLAVDAALRVALSLGQVDERDAGKAGGNVRADRGGYGWKDVHELRGGGDAASGELASGKLDDERNVQDFSIEQHAVLGFAVVAQPFAVIAAEDDERLIVEPALVEVGEKAADDRVRGGDLAVVRRLRVLRAERLDRLVRRVRLEEVEEEKE